MSKETNSAFDDVRKLNASAKELLISFGRVAIKARTTVITDPVNQKKAEDIVNLIDKDLREYNEVINQVEDLHKNWPSSPKRQSHYQSALTVGSRYVEIIDNIQQTMGEPAIDLVAILNEYETPPTEPNAV